MNPDIEPQTSISPTLPCPCGSGEPYESCCQPLHQGAASETAEALMRSRYTAFVNRLSDYLLQSWHSSTRPTQLDLSDSPVWASLQVLDSYQQGDKGQVLFRAIYRQGREWCYLEERSNFVREAGRWYYLKGKTRDGRLKPGRNDPCPCGGGRKLKQCCG